MKKLVAIICVTFYCLSGIAKDPGVSFVVTNEGKMECKKIYLGLNNARITLVNGEKMSVPVASISSYTIENKVFNRLPLFKDGKLTNRTAFMELVKTCGEFSLYKLEMCDFGSWDLHDKINCYFVYKEDKLHLVVDERSLPNICKFFDLTYSYR